MNPIKKWNSLGLFTRIMIGFVIGIAAGLILGENATKLAFLGTILTLALSALSGRNTLLVARYQNAAFV